MSIWRTPSSELQPKDLGEWVEFSSVAAVGLVVCFGIIVWFEVPSGEYNLSDPEGQIIMASLAAGFAVIGGGYLILVRRWLKRRRKCITDDQTP